MKNKILVITAIFISFWFGVMCHRAPQAQANNGVGPVKVVQYQVEEKNNIDTLSEWEMMMMAIMAVESKYDGKAKNGNQWGCFQITPIYIKEFNKITGKKYTSKNAYILKDAIEMFEVINKKYNPNRNINIAIKNHNRIGGYKYFYKVRTKYEEIKKYEDKRKRLIKIIQEQKCQK